VEFNRTCVAGRERYGDMQGFTEAYNHPMTKAEFTARKTENGKEFICLRCSGKVVKVAEKQYTRQRPYVMECKQCGLVSGSWDTDDEREEFLHEMQAIN
jgi:hypothetical protein